MWKLRSAINLLLVAAMLNLCRSGTRGVEIVPPNPAPRDSLIRVKSEGENKFRVIGFRLEKETGAIVPLIVDSETLGSVMVFTGGPGSYLVHGEENGTYVQRVVTISGTPGPGPDPGPTPDPEPGPIDDVPFPAPGFAVIVTYESGDTLQMSASQRAILTSSAILQYLSQKAVTLPDGKPAARFWDNDLSDGQLANVPQVLRDGYRACLQRSGGKPWVCISTGTRGHSGPLPGSVQEMLQLLKNYGG